MFSHRGMVEEMTSSLLFTVVIVMLTVEYYMASKNENYMSYMEMQNVFMKYCMKKSECIVMCYESVCVKICLHGQINTFVKNVNNYVWVMGLRVFFFFFG